ncbi:TROVE domain-containing protein [bacterium]|nr:TROVE domain-containing protein [bacterium]
MSDYASHLTTIAATQREPVPGAPTVRNSAGGYSFAVDDWTRLDRFLILGAEGGSYYATERALTRENAQAVVRCAQTDPVEAVRRIVAVSDSGRAPKNDPAVFALALVAAHADAAGKKAAYAAVPAVCRTGTHLFQFAAASDALRGWGRGLRQAVADWYTSKSARELGYQVAKYQQRDGWGHRDLLRLAHPKSADPAIQAVLRWVTHGAAAMGPLAVRRSSLGADAVVVHPAVEADLPPAVRAAELAKRAETEQEVARLVREHRLVRECVPTKFLNSPAVWETLLEDMPVAALVRNLATLTRAGVVMPGSAGARDVAARLTDPDRLRRGRVHPLALLIALKTYAGGRGVKGGHTWPPVPEVVEALDVAFYLAFRAVEPAGKRWLLALDVSGSMEGGRVAGSPLTPREAAAAMCLVTAATEPVHHVVGFTGRGFSVTTAACTAGAWAGYPNSGAGVEPLTVSPSQRVDEVVAGVAGLPMGPTDCALPMLYAADRGLAVDVFVVYTDNETWHGAIHPFQALREYREKTGIPAKLVVVGMVSNGFTIADPDDAGMLDVVGFDAAAPAVIADFAGQ